MKKYIYIYALLSLCSCGQNGNQNSDWYYNYETETTYRNGDEYSGKRTYSLPGANVENSYKDGKLNGKSTITWEDA